ncbi:MAG TPA: response regulator [Blastocatellia bacterium]
MNTETVQRQIILLIEDDRVTLPLLKALLNSLGYRIVTAIDEKDVVDNITPTLSEASLILLNQAMAARETLAAGRRIRDHLGADGDIPIVVIASEYAEQMEGKDEQDGKNDWITYLENSEQLRNLLGRLLP